MKRLILLSSLLVFIGCQKRLNEQTSFKIPSVQSYLKDRMVDVTFKNLDFAHAVIIPYKDDSFKLLKVPFANESSQFVLVRVEATEVCTSGKIIKLEGSFDEKRA